MLTAGVKSFITLGPGVLDLLVTLMEFRQQNVPSGWPRLAAMLVSQKFRAKVINKYQL
jgi:hypothetical protein